MSIASRARDTKRATTNSSTRPRLFGFTSTPEPISFSDLSLQAHAANRATHGKTPKGTRSGFGNCGGKLSGFGGSPIARNRKRKIIRLKNWILRDQARRAALKMSGAPLPPDPDEQTVPLPKPVGIATKVGRFVSKFFGRKEGAK